MMASILDFRDIRAKNITEPRSLGCDFVIHGAVMAGFALNGAAAGDAHQSFQRATVVADAWSSSGCRGSLHMLIQPVELTLGWAISNSAQVARVRVSTSASSKRAIR